MQIYFTKKELITLWLDKYPQDATHPDLEFNALAGYIKTKQSLFYWASYGLE